MSKLDWYDADEIGFALHHNHPDIEPLSASFTDLHAMVLNLADFSGDASGSCETLLEAIQMSWLEYFQEK